MKRGRVGICRVLLLEETQTNKSQLWSLLKKCCAEVSAVIGREGTYLEVWCRGVCHTGKNREAWLWDPLQELFAKVIVQHRFRSDSQALEGRNKKTSLEYFLSMGGAALEVCTILYTPDTWSRLDRLWPLASSRLVPWRTRFWRSGTRSRCRRHKVEAGSTEIRKNTHLRKKWDWNTSLFAKGLFLLEMLWWLNAVPRRGILARYSPYEMLEVHSFSLIRVSSYKEGTLVKILAKIGVRLITRLVKLFPIRVIKLLCQPCNQGNVWWKGQLKSKLLWNLPFFLQCWKCFNSET